MFNHLFLNITLYISGYAFLSVMDAFKPPLKHSMAFIMGTALWGIICVLFMLLGIPTTALSVPLGILATVATTYLITHKGHYILPSRNNLKSEALWLALFFLFFIIVNLLVGLLWYPHFSYDSYNYMAAGKAIANNGGFPMELPGGQFFLAARMVQLPALLSAGHLFGIELYFSLFPLFAIYLVLFTMLTTSSLLRTLDISRTIRALLVIIGIALMVLVPQYFFHSYYIHTNLITAGYYYGAIFGIISYKAYGSRSWLFLSGILLAAAALTRIEMVFFAFIPLSVLIADQQPDKRDFTIFMAIFLSITFGWHFYRLSFTGLETTYHNVGWAEFGSFFLFLLAWFLTINDKTFEKLARFAPQISVGLVFAISTFFAFYYNSQFKEAIKVLVKVLFYEKGQANWGWGRVWFVVFAAMLINLPMKKEGAMKHFFYILTIFFLFRIAFYSTPMLTGDSHFFSGSRMLLHIFPAAVLYVILVSGKLLSEIKLFQSQETKHNTV